MEGNRSYPLHLTSGSPSRKCFLQSFFQPVLVLCPELFFEFLGRQTPLFLTETALLVSTVLEGQASGPTRQSNNRLQKIYPRTISACRIISAVRTALDGCSDPSGKFVINTGFLTGLPRNGVPNGCTRTYVSFHSPAKEKNGNYGISYAAAGGLAGPHIKSCGIDGVVLEGKPKEPVGLMIDASGDRREANLTEMDPGLTTMESINSCFEEGYRGSVVVGPAGFSGVRFSSVMVSYMPKDHVRAAARGGPGMALGGMNVKAVGFKGGKEERG